MSINEAAIKKELQQLKKRQKDLQRQLDNGKSLKKQRLEAVRAIEEDYKSKFAEFNTVIRYCEHIESWNITLPSGKSLLMDHPLHTVKEEDLDKTLDNLKIYLLVRDILPEFELRSLSFKYDGVGLYHNKRDLSVDVSQKDNQLYVTLTKFVSEFFYSCNLDDKISLEVSADEEYASIRFVYKFTSTIEELFSNLATSLKDLDKFPWH